MITNIKRILLYTLIIFAYLLVVNSVALKEVLYAKIIFEDPIFLSESATQMESIKYENQGKYSIKDH
ncbi:MAG: hypothetical protein WC964_00640 [Acholeplasmataceae bacterium]